MKKIPPLKEERLSGQDNRFVQAHDVVKRTIAGETVLVPVRNSTADLDSIYTSNETGAMIWECMDGEKDVRQIADAICRRYDVVPEEATQDLFDFLRALEKAGLIQPVQSEK